MITGVSSETVTDDWRARSAATPPPTQQGQDHRRAEISVPTTPEDTAASVTSLLLVRIMARDETPEQSAELVTSLVLDGPLARRRPT